MYSHRLFNKQQFHLSMISSTMSQLLFVFLPLLLLVGKLAIGAKDVRPFDPDAKKFSCCSDHTVGLSDPICPAKKQIKCVQGESCRLEVQLRNGPATSSRQISHMFVEGSNTPCHPRNHSQIKCKKVDDYLFHCDCGRDDNFFGKCNPLGLLTQLKKQFCPVPPNQKSPPICTASVTQEPRVNSTTVRTTVVSGPELGNGEIVGIAIGTVAFVAIVITIIFRLCRRPNVAATPQPSEVEDRTEGVQTGEEIQLDIVETRNQSNLLSEIMLHLEQFGLQ